MATQRRGPKHKVDETPLPFASDKVGSERFAEFVETYLRVPSGHGVGQPMRLRQFQREIMSTILDGEPRPKVVGVMSSRGSGKTALLASYILYELFLGPHGNDIVSVATNERQAAILHRAAAGMIELDDELAKRAQIFRESIRVPARSSVYSALPAEARHLEGRGQWSVACVDEVGVVARDTWETILLGLGKVPGAVLCAIGTPSANPDSVLNDLREYGLAHPEDESFAWIEHSAAGFEDHPVDCRHCWRLAMPAVFDPDPFGTEADIHAQLPPKTSEISFRRSKLCQFPRDTGEVLPEGLWDSLARDEAIPPGAPVVIGFDGSYSGTDGTVIVAATISPTPHVQVVKHWVRPPDAGNDYRIPILEVEEALRDCCTRWDVREIAADSYRWQRSLEILRAENLPVSEFPQSVSRMSAATADFLTACRNGQLTHSNDAVLNEDLANCALTEDGRGGRLVKAYRSRRIDAAIAAVMAHSRATWLATRPKQKRRRVIGV